MKLTINGLTLTVKMPELEAKLDEIIEKENLIMGKLEDAFDKVMEIKVQVEVLNTALDGTRAIVEQMKTDLAALQSGEVLSDVVNGKVDSIITSADAALAEVKATYDENFPAAPPPTPEA